MKNWTVSEVPIFRLNFKIQDTEAHHTPSEPAVLQHLDVLHHVASLTRATAVGWEMKSQTLTSKSNRLERSPQTSSWQNAGHFLGIPMHQVVIELFQSFKILHWEKPSLKSNWAMGQHINCQIGHSWNNYIAKRFQP